MRNILLSFLLIGSSFLFFETPASASEVIDISGKQVVGQEQPDAENTIYFNGEKDDILITDDVIIRKLADSPNINLPNLSTKYNYSNNGIVPMGAGEWDRLGDELVKQTSGIYPSHGGDYTVIVSQSSYGPYLYSLREQDTVFNSTVKDFNFSESGIYEMVFRNISGWCDGDNDLAEFYIYKYTMTSTAEWISFFD